MSARKKLVAGNWKMNGLKASVGEIGAMAAGRADLGPNVELAVCPPATLAGVIAGQLASGGIALGGQDCHTEKSGAFTGDLSAEMWADLGAKYVIVGHSERRSVHRETNELVARKAAAVIRAGLTPIICLGESLEERDAGQTIPVITRQLRESIPDAASGASIVIAYEPIWAIGTGRTPTSAQVAEAHDALRTGLRERMGAAGEAVQILYGGSVKPENARELMCIDNVNGALVGGASLKAGDFLAIARACA
jgi:triosephosphate isomerase